MWTENTVGGYQRPKAREGAGDVRTSTDLGHRQDAMSSCLVALARASLAPTTKILRKQSIPAPRLVSPIAVGGETREERWGEGGRSRLGVEGMAWESGSK